MPRSSLCDSTDYHSVSLLGFPGQCSADFRDLKKPFWSWQVSASSQESGGRLFLLKFTEHIIGSRLMGSPVTLYPLYASKTDQLRRTDIPRPAAATS